VKIKINQTYPLREAAQAHADLLFCCRRSRQI
jgi:hypothetical protein